MDDGLGSPDIIHIHPTPLPIAARLLSQTRPVSRLSTKPNIPLPKRIQELVRQTD